MKLSKRSFLASAALLVTSVAMPLTGVAGIITTDTDITTTQASSVFVQSGTVTISNITISNLTAQGGDGSGGGAGMGGAVFVNTGANVTLTNVNVIGNQAIGGSADGSAYGGSLNGLFLDPAGTAGQVGTTPVAQHFLDANGTNGTNGGVGGVGGAGGAGGAGGGGDAEAASAPYITAVTVSSLSIAAFIEEAAGAFPFAAGEVPGILLNAAAAGVDLASNVAALVFYDKAVASGQIGVGGDGGNGGNAGASDFGIGGTIGGAGGAGGKGAENRSLSAFKGGAAGGAGGDGGEGGIGGFGAGGGTGGAGGIGGISVSVDQPYVKGVDPTYVKVHTDATYQEGYYWDADNNPATPDVFYATKTNQTSSTADGDSVTDANGVDHTTTRIVQTPASDKDVMTDPGSDEILASPAVPRPNGSTGAGGSGGSGGFGAGQGQDGLGSSTLAAGGSGGSGFGGGIFVRGGTLTIAGNSTFDGNDVRGGDGQTASATVSAGQAGSGYGSDMFIMKGATVNLTPGAGNTITFNGSIADNSVVSGYDTSIAAGNGASINISSGGTVVFNGTNTYSGTTFVTGTVLQAIDGVGVNAQSHISLDSGAIFQSSGTFTRRLGTGITQLTMGASSGFAANGGDLRVTLNTNSQLIWGSTTGFVTGALVFGSSTADSVVTLTNAISLNGAARTILVTDNTNSDTDKAVISGKITGAGGLTVGDATHTGILELTSGLNDYIGGTTIAGGTLALSGAGTLLSTGAVIANGTFDISQANGARTIGDLSGASSGVIALGANTLTVTQTTDGVFAGVIADGGLGGGIGGSFTKAGAANLTLSGANTYTGATNVTGTGTLTLSGSLVSNDVTIASGATLDDTAGGLASDTVATVNGTLTLTNTGDTIKTLNGASTGVVNVTGGSITVSDGTFAGAINGANGLVKESSGTLTLSGTNGYTGTTAVNAGTLTLSGTGSLASLVVNVASGATLNDNGGLTAGLASGAALTNAGTVVLAADDTVASYSSTGTLNGAGKTLTATTYALNDGSVVNANLGTGTVNANGTVAINGTSSASIHNIVTGTTTLGSAERLVDTTTVNISDNAKLVLGGAETITTLNSVGVGVSLAKLDNTAGPLTVSNGIFSGDITGTGALTKAGASGDTLTLSGANTFTGDANVNAGTLNLTGSLATTTVKVATGTNLLDVNGGLAAGATLTNAGTTTLTADDTITAYVSNGGLLNGTLPGSKLTAATYALNNNSVVTANLGTGVVTANGTVGISGTSDASIHNIVTGTTTLTGADRLIDTTTVNISDNATLVLGGAETITTLNSVGVGVSLAKLDNNAGALTVSDGTWSGDITGTSAVNKVSGGTLNLSGANTFTGAFNAQAGTTNLTGSLATTTVNITAGATLNDTASGLVSGAVVSNEGTLRIDTAAETITTLNGVSTTSTVRLDAALTVSNGTYAGIVAGTADLNKVSGGMLTLSGTSTHTGTVNVDAGTLNLTGSTASLAVNVASGATLLDVTGGLAPGATLTNAGTTTLTADDTITAYVSNGGLLNGTLPGSKLTAATYALNNNSVVTANLGTGVVTANGTVGISGTSDASIHNIVTGTTTLGSANRLIDTTTVNISDNATLVLGGAETITTLNSVGVGVSLAKLDNNGGTLTVSNGTFSGDITGTGALIKTGASGDTLTLSGANTFTGAANVNAGTLNLTGSLATNTVNVLSGATLTDAAGGLAPGATLTNAGTVNVTIDDHIDILNNTGTINGPGTLFANTYNLGAGSVINGNLGTGILYVDADVALNGTSAADTVIITGTGVLTLGSAERLSDNAVVTMTAPGVLNLGGTETILTLNGGGSVVTNGGSLILTNGTFAGVISGNGGLTKVGTATDVFNLSGANTYTGATAVNGGTLNLLGTIASTSVSVATGATLLDVAGGLAPGATLTNAGTVTLSADDTIAAFVSNGGSLTGAGQTLTAATYALNTGTTIDANLGAGALTANGTVQINGTSNASTVNIVTGTTTLGSASRLLDSNAAVTVATGATLVTAGSEAIGTINSPGTVVVSSGILTVKNGTVSGAINGAGSLTKISAGDLLVSGNSGYTGATVVSAGSLTLTGTLATSGVSVAVNALFDDVSGGLTDTAALDVSGTANIHVAERVGALTGASTGLINLIDGGLTVDSGNYAGAIEGPSTAYGLTKISVGTLTLSGASGFAGALNVNAGTVDLTGSLLTHTVNVATGAKLITHGGLNALTVLTVEGTADIAADDAVYTLRSVGTTGVVSLSGGDLTVSNGNYAGIITGSNAANSLEKVSAGELVLSGANTFTGDTHVVGGTLTLSGSGSLASGLIRVEAGTTLNNTVGGFASTAVLNNAGTVNLGATTGDTVATLVNSGTINGTTTLTAATYGLNSGSVINANLGLGVVTANGTVAINGTVAALTVNVVSGTTTLGAAERLADTAVVTVSTGATLATGGAEKIGTLLGDGRVVVTNGTITVSDGTFSGVIASVENTNGLTKADAGVLTLTGASTYLGVTTVTGGQLTLTGSLASRTVNIGAAGTLLSSNAGLSQFATVTNAGQFNLGGVNDTIAAFVTTGHTFGGTLTAATYALNDGSVTDANLGTGIVTANGTVRLNGTSDASQFNVVTGTTTLGSAERLIDTTTVAVSSGAKLVLGGVEKIKTLNGAGTVDINAGDFTVSDGAFGGDITGTSALNKVTVGALTLSGTNTFTGAANVNAGTVNLTGSLATVAVNIASGATLNDTAGGLASGAVVSLDGTLKVATVADTITTLNGASTGVLQLDSELTVSNGTFAGVVAGAGILDKASIDTLTLSGTSTHTGTVNVNEGVLNLTGSTASLAVNVASGATLLDVNGGLASGATLTNAGTTTLSADDTIGAYVSDGGLLDGTGLKLTAATYALNDGTVVDANLGTGTVTANGTVALNGTSDASQFNIVTGTTTLGSAERLIDTTAVAVSEGATLVLGGSETIKTLNGAGTVDNGAGDFTVSDGAFSGDITGASAFNKVSSGELTLSGANTFTGAANVNEGTLSLTGTLATNTVNIASGATLSDVAGGLTDTSTVRVDGTLALGANETIDRLRGSGTVSLGGSELTVSHGWFTGAINGTGDLVVAGGWLGLTGDSGYTGTTTVASGTLSLRGTLASSSVTVAEGALLDNRSGGLADTTALTVDGTMNLGAAEEVASLAGSGTVDLGSSLLTVSSGDFSGAIDGSGDLTKVSEGTLTLSGVSGYTGTTTVSAGTLTLTGSLASQSVSVASGATLNSEHAGLSTTSTLTNAGTVLIGETDQTVGAYVSNAGQLNGTAKLTAATYELNDGTTVSANLGAGTMTVSGNVTLAGTSDAGIITVNSGANLTLVSADRLSDDAVVTVEGTLTLLGGDDTISQLFGSGVIDGGASNHILHVLNGGLFTGTIANNTVVLNSSGDLTLTGHSDIAELVHVTGGTLTLAGSDASITTLTITVDAGAALTVEQSSQLEYLLLNGAGTINFGGTDFVIAAGQKVAGTLTFNGNVYNLGVLAPGNSPGITTILGNYTEGGLTQLEIGGTDGPGVNPTGFDQTRVGGTVTLLNSGTMVVEGFNGFAPVRGQSFQLISDLAGGTKQLNGSLSAVQFDIDGIAGSGLPVTNAAGVLDLRTGRVITSGLNAANSKFSDLGVTGNEKAAIAAIFSGAQVAPNQIDTATAAGDAAAQLLFSTGNASTTNLAFFIPTGYEALLDYGAASSRLAARLNDRVSSFNTLPASQSLNGGFYAGTINAETKTTHDNARYTRNDYYAGADFGVAKGFELGVYANGNTGSVRNDTLRSEASGVGAGIYGKAGITDRLGVKGSFAYSADEFDNKRRTLAGNVESDTSVDTFSGALTLEYLAYKGESFSLAPRAGFVGTESRAKGFSESGASDALHIDAFSSTRISARAGASAVWSTRSLGLPLSLEVTGDVDQALYAEATDLDASFVNNAAVRYPLRPEDDRDTSFIYGVNAGVGITDSISMFVGYQGRIGYTPSNDFNVSVRVRF